MRCGNRENRSKPTEVAMLAALAISVREPARETVGFRSAQSRFASRTGIPVGTGMDRGQGNLLVGPGNKTEARI